MAGGPSRSGGRTQVESHPPWAGPSTGSAALDDVAFVSLDARDLIAGQGRGEGCSTKFGHRRLGLAQLGFIANVIEPMVETKSRASEFHHRHRDGPLAIAERPRRKPQLEALYRLLHLATTVADDVTHNIHKRLSEVVAHLRHRLVVEPIAPENVKRLAQVMRRAWVRLRERVAGHHATGLARRLIQRRSRLPLPPPVERQPFSGDPVVGCAVPAVFDSQEPVAQQVVQCSTVDVLPTPAVGPGRDEAGRASRNWPAECRAMPPAAAPGQCRRGPTKTR